MLILSRQRNEVFYICNDIRVEILSIHGDRVKVGISAPESMSILRGELLEASSASANAVEPDWRAGLRSS